MNGVFSTGEDVDTNGFVASGFGVSLLVVEVSGLAMGGVLGEAIARMLGLGTLGGADDAAGLEEVGAIIGPTMTLGGVTFGAGAGM